MGKNRMFLFLVPVILASALAFTVNAAAASKDNGRATGTQIRNATAASGANPVVGEWTNKYGKIVIQQTAKNTFTSTAVTPLELIGGSTCRTPAGTSQGTITGKGPTYSASITTYFASNCAPAGVASFTFTVSGNTLSETGETWTRVPLSITTASLPGAKVNHAYSTNLAATGGGIPYYLWHLAKGSAPLPKGLVLNEITGTISGVPTKKTNVTIDVQVTNLSLPSRPAPSGSATRKLTLSVS